MPIEIRFDIVVLVKLLCIEVSYINTDSKIVLIEFIFYEWELYLTLSWYV